MSAWNKFDVFIVILSCAEAIASLVIGQYVNDEINKMEGNTTSSLKILKLFKGMDSIKVSYINSHATKKLTSRNSSWSCTTKGIDFSILTRDRAISEF